MSRFYISVFFLLLFLGSFGQRSEYGIFAGGSYYNGELNPTKQITPIRKISLGALYRFNINKRYALKFILTRNQLEANDKITGYKFNRYRDYQLNSTFWDLSGNIEFNFLPYKIGDSRYPFTPYVFTGLTGYYASSESYFVGSGNVENKNNPQHSKTFMSVAFPFGAGFKFNVTKTIGIGIEWGMRKLFTDEFDALPDYYYNNFQKSTTFTNDWYSIVGLSLHFRPPGRNICPGIGIGYD